MFFREVINEDLGCASYVITDSGKAVLLDPMWDIEGYKKSQRRTAKRRRA